MITIYHYPKCSKSRAALCELEQFPDSVVVRNYFIEKFSKEELLSVLKKANLKPLDVVRKKETIWKENYENKALSEAEVVEALLAFPQLIERPLVVNQNKAVLARPIENLNNFLLHF